MKTSTRVLWMFVTLIGLTTLAGDAWAFCCSSNGGICGDCTQGTPYCATGPCNMFGCNCDGSCRSGPCDACPPVTEEARLAATTARFDAIDTDDDHTISWKETRDWAGRSLRIQDAELRRKFKSVDANGNGRIEPGEFDRSLASSSR